jgi:hypothetical protein
MKGLSMHLLAIFVAIATSATAAPVASSSKVAEAAAATKLRQLRARLGKVLEHASALPPTLAAEAKHVDDDAATALRGTGAVGFEKVVAEFAAFSGHLTDRSADLQREAENIQASHLPAGALEKAKKLLPGLDSKVRKVLEHLKADKGPESPAHASLIKGIELALASGSEQNAFERAVALHNALKSAHDFLAKRTQDLAADRERLTGEIEDQQAFILYMMLKQRRKLPVKAQMALLKRHQFKDFKYAQMLLKSHAASQPLDVQLLALLPKAMAEKLTQKTAQGKAGNLAAAGSDGRVQIVSSRMKNVVQTMAAGLAKAKTQLDEMVKGTSITAAEKKQAMDISSGLEGILKKVASTHDLKAQLDAMDEMQNKLKTWMLNAAKHN